jgi:hypothetical protein
LIYLLLCRHISPRILDVGHSNVLQNKRIQPWIIYLTRAVQIRNRIIRGKVHISKERLDVIFFIFFLFYVTLPFFEWPIVSRPHKVSLNPPTFKKALLLSPPFLKFQLIVKVVLFFPWLLPRLVAKRPPFFLPHLPWDGISHGFEFRQQEKSKWFFSFLFIWATIYYICFRENQKKEFWCL